MATSAPRASRSATCTTTPTGCGVRYAGPTGRRPTTWVEIGWDEALDLVADGLAGAVNRHGRDAVGVYLGNPNAHSLGFATHGIAMVKSLRTRNRFSASSVDQIPHQFVASLLFGHQLMIPISDIDRTSYFLVFGANPMASNGSLMTVPDFPQRLRDLKARGGRMVVVDPRRTETARVADEHVFVRPGTDAVVLLAMLHVLLEEHDDPAGGVRRRRRPGPRGGRATSPRSMPRASAASRPRPSAGSRASSPRPTAPRRTADSGCRRRASGRSASGRSSASTR